ncbi:AlkA N-terminal domain-containing protein [Kordiimonas sp.]|uniref:AlkA N-terminal domain-containing protein n=1 Tax=Kordiimonas sp. TaxID=1970157 RepID=UPI003B5284ED
MMLDTQICYNALKSRDARFDGKFYIAVRTTGVYCRPICPAPTAHYKNCTFYATAARAETAGYRPCLRCFPEQAPGYVPREVASDIVIKAIDMIQHDPLENGNMEALAEDLGISSRHLRRLFEEHLGISPMQLVKTRRVQMAKKLITETSLSMTQIAFIAGFPTIAQFNVEMKKTYFEAPSALRRRYKHGPKHSASDKNRLHIRLAYRPPYDWAQVGEYLAGRMVAGVERFEHGRYRRLLTFDDASGVIEVCGEGRGNWLTLHVPMTLWPHLQHIIAKCRALFDLDADTDRIETRLANNPLLKAITNAKPGARVLGAWDPFELAIRAIIGQQITVVGATTLTNRLVEHTSGDKAVMVEGERWLPFPTPEEVIAAPLEKLGFIRTRAATLRAFSQRYGRGDLTFPRTTTLEEKLDRLTAIKGIGPWTAGYIAMRGMGEPDAYPYGDLGLVKAYGLTGKSAAKELHAALEAIRPWRAYATMHLWRSLVAGGNE